MQYRTALMEGFKKFYLIFFAHVTLMKRLIETISNNKLFSKPEP